ncbi:MAG: hypothetical protein IKK63_06405 [Clostridia bacterium]|nr:hypothetical protein [Clostridia bacterium]
MKKVFSVLLAFVMLFSVFQLTVFADVSDKNYIIVTDTVAVNSGEDVSSQIQSIIDENPNRTIYFPDGEYLVSQPILTPANPRKSVSLELSDFAVVKVIGEWKSGEAVIQLGGKDPYNDTHTNGSNYAVEGGIIDGSGVANGISVNSGRETAIRDVSIKNTVVGIHIMYGANSGSSDADISGVNIIGTGKTDSVGILVEGFDNTITNVRIGHVFTGVHLKGSGNMLRNVHPLYYSDYTDYQNSCGFLDESGNNWFDYCYSDQFAIGFRTTGYAAGIYNNCFCYWYSPDKDRHTAFKADKGFNSTLTNFKADFKGETPENVVLDVGAFDGTGKIENLSTNTKAVTDFTYLAYEEDASFFERVYGFFFLIFGLIK